MPINITVNPVQTPGADNGNLIIQENTDVFLYQDSELGRLRIGEYFAVCLEALFPAPISLNDIKQSDIANCLLLSILQAIVLVNPEALKNMLCVCKDERGQEYVCVRVSDSHDKLIAVEKTKLSLHGYDFLHEGTQHLALWVHMIEKAYVAFQQDLTIGQNLNYIEALCKGSREPSELCAFLSFRDFSQHHV